MRIHPTADTKFANHLLTLVMMVDRGDYLPKGFETREQFINKFATDGAANKNVTAKFIDSHRDPIWNWSNIIGNPNVNMKHIEALNLDDRMWQFVALFPHMTADYVISHPEKPWNWSFLSQNSNMTLEIINTHPELPWDLGSVCINPNITEKFVLERLDDFRRVSFQVSRWVPMTIETINSHPNFPWCWASLTLNKHISLDVIKKNPTLPWVDHLIGVKQNITIEDIKNNPDVNWVWNYLIGTQVITFEFIKENQHLWTAEDILQNPNITWKDIEANPNGIYGRPWDKRQMSYCKDLTWKKIIELDDWDWQYIFRNQFGK